MAQCCSPGTSLCKRTLAFFLVYSEEADPAASEQGLLPGDYLYSSGSGSHRPLYDEPASGKYPEGGSIYREEYQIPSGNVLVLSAGLIFLVSSFYYLPFFALCAAAVFMALILRVIKNVFAQAEEIKKENDYTI